jgi:replicative DNA helicase
MSDDGYDPRTPPQNLEAEQSVLGALMLSKDAIAEVIETLTGPDFYRPHHEAIFDAILELYGQGEPVDVVTVGAELEKRGDLTKVGGSPYLHTLVATVPAVATAPHYAGIVRKKAVQRRLAETGVQITQIAFGAGEADDMVDAAETALYGVSGRRARDDYRPVGDIVEATIGELETIGARGGELVGVPTGFADLDDLLNGLHPGQLVVVAGRPGMGKSTWALDAARSAAIRHGLTSVIFSLEMSSTEITMRMLSAEARVSLTSMRKGHLKDDDWHNLAARMNAVSAAPLFIDDSPNMTMVEIRAKARRLKQRNDLRLVVVDYLQLMSSGKRVESRQVEVSEFSRQLKLLAKELEVPVVAVSQLNRGPEQRSDKRPMMADLRESGSIEADSDVVILLHRDDAYKDESTRPGEADLIVAKQRNGPTGTVVVAFQGHYSRFVDMAQPDPRWR